MQVLRRVTVNIQKSYVASMRTYSARSTARGGSRKTKEERFQLVVEFIAKYQASHNGEFPSLSIVRKEVGGKYETLKEIYLLENIKQSGKLDGSSSVIFSGSEKQPVTERALRKGLKICTNMTGAECFTDCTPTKAVQMRGQSIESGGHAFQSGKVCLNCTNMTEPECVTDSTTIKAVEQRALSMESGDHPSQSGKVDNDSGCVKDHHVRLSQQTAVLEVPGNSDFPAEFPLFLCGVSEKTTSKDLREAFQDCGEIWNTTTLKYYDNKTFKEVGVDAIVNFKTEGGLKAARMKETVLLRGVVFNINNTIHNRSTARQVKQVTRHPARYYQV